MKKILIIIISIGMLMACSKEKSVEERYLYQGEKIVDVETGDEYIIEDDPGQFTIIHPDGTTEKVDIDKTPFFGTSVSDKYIQNWKEQMEERKEELLIKRQEELVKARKEKYANFSDEELIKKFREVTDQNGEMALRREMLRELVDRGAVKPGEDPELFDPKLLEIEEEIQTNN